MNNSNDKSQNNHDEQQPISTSLQLALIAAILTTIADGIATISAIAAIDEARSDAQKEKQDQSDSDERLDRMQKQIDQLTKELAKFKSSRF
ncbi:hypothetical protein M3197_03385 [Sporosarcina aquimarina]|uniref:hypothetical protein n=1 Tax=Sporosarcina aquimarina TaxID=114975 RepID=UPI00203B1A96|nr:hypothetical protein [Sporosarcina aquimarina]MCM3756520.1 hypothetical protein [Sporosarcina aquimarina]